MHYANNVFFFIFHTDLKIALTYFLLHLFSDPTKYFGCELGAQTNFDAKNERYIVNGEHDANRLQDLLDGFIKKFVLCKECQNPETALVSSFCVHGLPFKF